MAKGPSSKKVARAARAGGGRVRGVGQRSLLFPGIIAVICVLGVALVAYARDERRSAERVPPLGGDHWHAAYGVYLCDEFQPAVPEFESQVGIHTHGDGVIHIHPFSELGQGTNATLERFFEETDVEITDTSIRVGERTLENGDDCGEEPGRVVVAKWDRAQDEAEEPDLITEDVLDTRFRKDGEAYTIAFVPQGTEIPRPPTSEDLEELGAVDAGAPPPDTSGTEPGATSTTAGDGTSTTAGDGTSTTGAGGTTTTESTAPSTTTTSP